MLLRDDGDLVRAVGYVAIYHADLEDMVDQALDALSAIAPVPHRILRSYKFSAKVDHLESDLVPLLSGEDRGRDRIAVEDAVGECRWCGAERNRILHAPIVAFPSTGLHLQVSARHGSREVTSGEIYAVAQRIWWAVGLVHKVHFAIGRLPAEARTAQ